MYVHDKSILHKCIQHLTKFEVVPVMLWRHRCRKNCSKFTILSLITLGKRLNHLLESCILLNVLYLRWYDVLLWFWVSADAYGISMMSERRQNDVIWQALNFCTLQVTQSIKIVSIHVKSVLWNIYKIWRSWMLLSSLMT